MVVCLDFCLSIWMTHIEIGGKVIGKFFLMVMIEWSYRLLRFLSHFSFFFVVGWSVGVHNIFGQSWYML
jgi:hypothetical protein